MEGGEDKGKQFVMPLGLAQTNAVSSTAIDRRAFSGICYSRLQLYPLVGIH